MIDPIIVLTARVIIKQGKVSTCIKPVNQGFFVKYTKLDPVAVSCFLVVNTVGQQQHSSLPDVAITSGKHK
jgi:hypothetical protein